MNIIMMIENKQLTTNKSMNTSYATPLKNRRMDTMAMNNAVSCSDQNSNAGAVMIGILVSVLTAIVIVLIQALIVMILWNWVIPHIWLNAPSISFTTAIGLVLLIDVLWGLNNANVVASSLKMWF